MNTFIIIIFVAGYAAIAMEHFINVNKAAAALITAAVCWTLYILSGDPGTVNLHLYEHLGEAAGILFFLLGAMTIVEIIDAHNGFDVITSLIKTRRLKKILWITCWLAFILSAILDNLTTTIVMLSLVRKLIDDKKERMLFAGMIVIAANAGGAWSPIGDVTTTMLWIGGQVSAMNIILKILLPSIVCLLVPLTIISRSMNGTVTRPIENAVSEKPSGHTRGTFIFLLGVSALLFVPVFKTLTGLPPFMGMLFSLGVMWTATEIIHRRSEKDQYSVVSALQKIDTPSILFFLGILLSIGVLESTGELEKIAGFLSDSIPDINMLASVIGIMSAVIDNVPLVAASQGMFSLDQYPLDHHFWEMLAFTTGTGGSILIIGSAAGIVAMGVENISFFWYLRKFSLLAFAGFVAGVITYILQELLL